VNDRRGFTLVELLVAIAIFSILGLMLVTMVHRSIEVWRRGEAQREMFESARMIGDQFAADLDATYTNKSQREVRPDLVFLCGPTSAGQRLLLIRTIGNEGRTPQVWSQAMAPAAAGHDGFFTGLPESRPLRATGGLCEVLYALHPDPARTTLLRGLRAPIGIGGSLRALVDAADLERACQVLARDVIHLGFEFWTAPNGGSGQWLDRWDSTRGLDPEFALHVPGSDQDPRDDVWPWAVRLTITIRNGVRRPATLQREVGANDRELSLSTTEGFPSPDEPGQGYLKLGNEWIEVDRYRGDVVYVRRRGARGTTAQNHSIFRVDVAGEPLAVEHGRTFVIVRDLPVVGMRGR
jgi:prepilin-type N-terminal cleavage/methylation domain-containing protein